MVAMFNQLFGGLALWRREKDDVMLWAEVSDVELELFDLMFQCDGCQLGW